MTRAARFATIGVIWIIAITVHYFGVILFAPGTDIYALGAPGVGTYIQAGWRDQMYKVFVQFIPLSFIGLSALWGFAKEYEDAVLTGRGRV